MSQQQCSQKPLEEDKEAYPEEDENVRLKYIHIIQILQQ